MTMAVPPLRSNAPPWAPPRRDRVKRALAPLAAPRSASTHRARAPAGSHVKTVPAVAAMGIVLPAGIIPSITLCARRTFEQSSRLLMICSPAVDLRSIRETAWTAKRDTHPENCAMWRF